MENNMKISKGSILFYVFAVIFLLITAYSIYMAYDYVASYTASATTAPAIGDVIKLYIDYAGAYLAYSVICYGIGYIIHKLGDLTGALTICADDAKEIFESEADEIVSDVVEENK